MIWHNLKSVNVCSALWLRRAFEPSTATRLSALPIGIVAFCLWVVAGNSLNAQANAQATAPEAKATQSQPEIANTEPTASSEAAPKADRAVKKKREKAPEFVRVYKKDKTPIALQTAVATYVPDPAKVTSTEEHLIPANVEVALIGAVHIGSPEYYGKLNELFQKYDALLYELVADPALGIPDPSERGLSPVSTIQVGMKEALGLAFQLDLIDYRAKNFVHADLTPDEFFSMLEKRKEGMMQLFFRSLGAGIAMQSSGKTNDLELMSALMAENQQVAVRRAMAEQMGSMDGQMAAITGEDGKSTLITERNARAFEVLKREMDAGKKSFGVFYGAGHLKDMHQRLIDDFGLKLNEVTWLDAWDLTE